KEDTFTGIIDLIEDCAYIYKDDLGKDIEQTEIPEEYKAKAEELRNEMIEKIVETDEELTTKYLEGEEVTADELRVALRKATCGVEIVPVLCGSSYKNKGVQRMLDAVVEYLPSPVDVPDIKGTLEDGTEVS